MQGPWGKAVKSILVLLLIFPWLTGCWDRLELEERATLLGLAVDVAPPEAEKHEDQITETDTKEGFPPPGKEMIKVTAQIAIPGRIPLGPGQGGQGQGGGAQQSPVWVIQVMGHTPEDALHNMQQQVAQQLYLGHLRVIIVSEKLAKRGLKKTLDSLQRNPEIRRSSYLLVSKGPASQALTVAPPLERVPTLYLSALLDQAAKMGKFPETVIGTFFTAYAAKGREGYLPYIQPKGGNKNKSHIEINGMAYFREDKIVGKTEPMEIASFMEIKGIEQAGYSVSVPVPGHRGNVIIRGFQRRTKTFVELRRGKPVITVHVHVDGELDEKSNQLLQIRSPELLRSLERETTNRLQKMNEKFIRKLQKKGSDIFAFGEQVRAKQPEYWNRQIRTKRKWRQAFKNVEVKVYVTGHIRRTGMRAK